MKIGPTNPSRFAGARVKITWIGTEIPDRSSRRSTSISAAQDGLAGEADRAQATKATRPGPMHAPFVKRVLAAATIWRSMFSECTESNTQISSPAARCLRTSSVLCAKKSSMTATITSVTSEDSIPSDLRNCFRIADLLVKWAPIRVREYMVRN